MNLPTIVAALAVLSLCAVLIRTLARERRRGGCGGACSSCRGCSRCASAGETPRRG